MIAFLYVATFSMRVKSTLIDDEVSFNALFPFAAFCPVGRAIGDTCS
jgi:hypothetical protein